MCCRIITLTIIVHTTSVGVCCLWNMLSDVLQDIAIGVSALAVCRAWYCTARNRVVVVQYYDVGVSRW